MGYDLSNSRKWVVPYGGKQREVLRVENAAGVIMWEKYYRVSYEANSEGMQYWIVYFNANGGSGSMSSLQVPKGSSVQLPACAFSQAGYVLKAQQYNTAADGSGESYSAGALLMPTANMTLYAQWQANSYTISFNPGEGSGSMSPVTAAYRSNVVLPACTFTRSGYVFDVWECIIDGEESYFNDQDSFVMPAQDLSLSAQWAAQTDIITEVNAVIETSAPAGTIDSQSRSYGYMVWTGSDLPVWIAGASDVFGSESRLGQGLQSRSVTANGYNGQSRTTTAGGCGGIALKSIQPSGNKLYTQVKLSPYIGVYVVSESGGAIMNDGWYYTDRGIKNDPAMNFDGSQTITGRSYYSRGEYFNVKMTVEDSAGEHVFSVPAQAPSALNGWSKTALSPTVLTFDFKTQLESAGLYKGAKTTKIEFFEGTTSQPVWPAAVNAVCLYTDTLN